MAEQDFLPFATGVGADVLDQADYAAAPWVPSGFADGIALTPNLNKVWRQSSFVSAAIAQYIQNQLNVDVLDNADLAGFIANLTNAIATGAAIKPAAVITASANLNIAVNQYALGFARVAGVAALNAQLLGASQVGQEFVIEDLVGNFNAFPVTILPPVGDTISSNASWVCNRDNGSWRVRKYANNFWGISNA